MKAMERFTVAEKRWLLVGIALHKIVHPAICQALKTEAGHPVPYGCLDISAAIDRLNSENAFAFDLQKAATKLRSKVRNKWAHSVMNEWIDKEHFHTCFLAMRKVIDLLPYPSPAVRERTSMRLRKYEEGDATGNLLFNPYHFFPGGDGNSQTVVAVPEPPSVGCELCGYTGNLHPSAGCESCGYTGSLHPSPPPNGHPSDDNGSSPIEQSMRTSKWKFSWLHLTGGAVLGFAVGVLLASVPGKCGEVVRSGSVPIVLRLEDMIKACSHLRLSS
ncbi:PREDICTED: uncharacterized protein LOC109478743 [Branchiostoma belcheri]|uniref:Uncharacterized protein LOC109478743 n=1 Tax=Branchiostoma belcheri TaxID=7741 RepID=A0A6P4Z3C2_BRABE|nr:PREDICTED: uncharacterized protein LOC109478743 [Branchiostoma belcheri]